LPHLRSQNGTSNVRFCGNREGSRIAISSLARPNRPISECQVGDRIARARRIARREFCIRTVGWRRLFMLHAGDAVPIFCPAFQSSLMT
jgi:hypothetical protein